MFETFHHYLLEYDVRDYDVQENELITEEITKENMNDVGSSIGNTTRKWISSGYPYAKGYCFRNEDNEIVGSCWMMLKGGDEKLYRVRDHEAFLFRLEVLEQFRGKKYSKKIMNNMIGIAKDMGFESVAFVVATKNNIALNLHGKMGAKKFGERFFVRILDRNIPYYSI